MRKWPKTIWLVVRHGFVDRSGTVYVELSLHVLSNVDCDFWAELMRHYTAVKMGRSHV